MVLAALLPIASATPTGNLDLTNCDGGGVTVSAFSIDWTRPVGNSNGCVQTGVSSSLAYSDGTLRPGQTGTILDLHIVTNPLPVAGFISFSGLSFDLTEFGPGPSTSNCSGLKEYEACAPFAGSPFWLQRVRYGTVVILAASGTVSDATGISNWAGAFTTQLSGKTPLQLQKAVCPGGVFPCTGGGTIRSTYSASFDITAPEPTTIMLTAFGGLFLLIGGIRRKR